MPRILNPGESKVKLHPKQWAYYHSQARFNVASAGRRSGKTDIAKRRIFSKSMRHQKYPRTRYLVGAPTHQQAKNIYWEDLKTIFKPWTRSRIIESELKIPLFNGADVQVIGLDRPQRVEGSPVDWIFIDEIDDIKPEAWQENIRPALTDHLGGADFYGVPEGRRMLKKLFSEAHADKKGEWAAFSWWTEHILPLYLGKEAAENEIASAMADMDEHTFRREYRAEFVDFAGRVYYSFSRETHCDRLEYDDELPLIFCFDFNVSPGVAAIYQNQRYIGKLKNVDRKRPISVGIGEVHVPHNSNTEIVCNRLIKDWGFHKGDIMIYGDATGGSKGSAQLHGSDWDIIRNMFRPVFGRRARYRYKRANPTERSRVNAMNTRLKAADGTIRMLVDPKKCPHLVEDFEDVSVLKGGSGEIDKKSNEDITHLTDAVGYWIETDFPVTSRKAPVSVAI